MSRAKPPIKMYPIRKRLPQQYNSAIGRIIMKWALLDQHLRDLTYLLLETGRKRGRIAIRQPRTSEYVTMIKDLMLLLDINSSVDLGKLKKGLEDLSFYRNGVAHGIWLKHPDTSEPVLQIIGRGYEYAPGKKSKALIDPESLPVSIQLLQDVLSKTNEAIETVIHISAEVNSALATLPQTPRAPWQPNLAALHSHIHKSPPTLPKSFGR